uniref:Uncharacterized protein n=1 Tax=Desertifilum tharense IPPAS B-1220 TaxID=1781255 RepID=A0ACD5GUA3_9CYAN
MGKKGIGSWELGVGEEGNSGLTLITSRLLSSRNFLNSALFSHWELGTLSSPSPHLPTSPSLHPLKDANLREPST